MNAMHEGYRNSLAEIRDNYRKSWDELKAEDDERMAQVYARVDGMVAQVDGMTEHYVKSLSIVEKAFSMLQTEPPRKAGRRSQDDEN